jgi:hypothetical protein
MKIQIELSPEEEQILKAQAEREGIAFETFLHKALLEVAKRNRPISGAEAIDHWRKRGLLGHLFTDYSEDSPELSLRLRQEAEKRIASG